jgi:hypothetical protein
MYQYSNTGNAHGDMPPSIDEHAIIRYLGWDANAIKPYPNDTGMVVDIPPRSQPDRALSALNYRLTPTCNLSPSHYGRTPIACAHATGNSNTYLSQVSYRNLLRSQYKQGCNQCEHPHTQVYQHLKNHQVHLSASVSTSPVERTNERIHG